MFELEDQQTGRIKCRGTEKECLEYSAKNPNCKYILRDLEKDKKKRKTD